MPIAPLSPNAALRPASSRRAASRSAASRPVRGTLRALLALALLALPLGAAWAQKASPLLREEAKLALPAPAGAVAINADESILAAATPGLDGRWNVQLFDRPSRARLGVIVAAVGEAPRLRFSPVDDLLLVAGAQALQLWELPIAPLDPEQPLSEEHRRWEVKLAAPAAEARFGTPPGIVYWSQGANLFRRSTQTGAAYDGKPFWQPGEKAPPLSDFSFDPESASAALVYKQRKEVDLLDLNRGQLQRSLQGHRFPVLAARFSAERPLLTLDAGNNLVQWQGNERAVATTFLDQVPEGFRAAGFTLLGEHHLLLLGQDGRALAIDERTARPVATLRADGPQRVAVSPTGRYVLAGEGRTLHLYGFALPSSPLAYVRQLRRLKAYELAQSYVRLLDERTISPQLRTDLLNEAGREPPGQELQKALAHLKQAEQEHDGERIRYWAEQVLALQPEHPDAVAALRRLREVQDGQTLQQAREAYRAGQNRVAISLLFNQIQDDSRYYAEAQELIRQAEAKRSVETALIQAREKLNLRDYTAAEALVKEALRKEKNNPAALALKDEIDDRSGATERQLVAALIGLVLAMLLVGFLALRFRRQLAPYLRKLRLDEEPPVPAPLGRGMPRPQPEPHSAAQPHARTAYGAGPTPGRAPPRRQAAGPARRKVLEQLIHETEERLHRLREADVFGQYTARLMEFAAELSAIARRVVDPMAELGPLHSRLKAIQAQLRKLRVKPHGASSRAEARQEPHRNGQRQGARQQEPGDPPRSPPGAAPNGEPTHYEVLQLRPDASLDEIKAAYHRLLKQYHPDLHTASEFDWVRAESERMSRRISAAYQVLSNADSRSRYDRELRDRKGASA